MQTHLFLYLIFCSFNFFLWEIKLGFIYIYMFYIYIYIYIHIYIYILYIYIIYIIRTLITLMLSCARIKKVIIIF